MIADFSTHKLIVPQNSGEYILDRIDVYIGKVPTRVGTESFDDVGCLSVSRGLRSGPI